MNRVTGVGGTSSSARDAPGKVSVMMHARVCLAILCAVVVACGKDTSGPNARLEVRVRNESSAAIMIRIGDTDYGSIAAGQTSPYREVDEGVLPVRLNGVVVADATFCTGACEVGDDMHWTAFVTDDGWLGYATDDGLWTVSRSRRLAPAG